MVEAYASVCGNNHPNGFQVVVVLGEFVGGEVVFSDDYTDGNLIIIPNRHGTIFVGKNSKVIHRVFSVLSGHCCFSHCISPGHE